MNTRRRFGAVPHFMQATGWRRLHDIGGEVMRTSVVFVVGFRPEQRERLVRALNSWGVRCVVTTDECGLLQSLWPAMAGDRLEARPSLLVADGTCMSETGLDVLNALGASVNVMVTYDAEKRLGFELVLQWLRQRLGVAEALPESEPLQAHEYPSLASSVPQMEQEVTRSYSSSVR